MKRFLALLICSLIAGSSFAQKKVDSYTVDYFTEGEEYDIKVHESNGNISLYFNVEGENTSDKVSFSMKENQIILFIEALKQAKDKYVEWTEVAQANDVKDMSKNMDIIFPSITVGWYAASDWRFEFSHKLSPRFMVTNDGKCLFLMTGKVTASDNKYLDKKYYFVLSSVSEFDELMSKISPDNLRQKLNQENQTIDLFK